MFTLGPQYAALAPSASVGSLLRRLREASAAIPPGRPLWDVAMTARYWVPMPDPASATALYPAGLDAPARLRILADSYDLSLRERAELPGVIEQATAVCRAFVARRVADGDTVCLRALAGRGGWERWDRIQAWLVRHRETFTAALLD